MFKTICFCFFIFLAQISNSQTVKTIDLGQFQQLLKTGNNIKIINFWATWCAPCVAELPHFEAVYKKNKNIDMYLVSLDFLKEKNNVERFVQKKQLKIPIYILSETDANVFVPAIEASWEGSVPASLFINTSTGQRVFFEKPITETDIQRAVMQLDKN
jgi:thiol-disulfide isomerase/thioredoxin